ncbi:uncharacterized protein LOC132193241 [Neocloeon triangulifer]|uniref:uncharacterized protein LOC132193241 n=1 Tax=Neocloeon triangulifer TaxID=2078957 RepID=UPI00286F4888|nr:uncharacterized protein LOC132193241 [Neocloeon triangulifer]
MSESESKMHALWSFMGRRRVRQGRFMLLAACSVAVFILVISQGLFRERPLPDNQDCFRNFRINETNVQGSYAKWLAVFGGLFLPQSSIQQDVFDNWYRYPKSLSNKMNRIDVRGDEGWLLDAIRDNFLMSPSTADVPYCLENPNLHDPSMGQSQKIMRLLNNQTNGFFVECGALDGETRSNTLYFERFLGWKGLLIEADPLNFMKALPRRRKAWLSPTCLSLAPHPTKVSFKQKENQGSISKDPAGVNKEGQVDVQCLPLYTLLLALNRTSIDYFSLDVEGSELAVLKTIPFDKVDIKTLSVEFIHVGGGKGKEDLRHFMEAKGYVVDSEVTHPNWLANDFIFVRKDLLSSN